ncbi:MAG: SAM-dependent methyltransferase, partial [Pseudomonadota bacterium]
MAFDQTTRKRLSDFVNEARRTLEEEFTRQLQNDYGLDPVLGAVTAIDSLRHLNDAQRETARILR